jgi:hypothetical protein
MTEPEADAPATSEGRFHDYTGNRIPWWVRLAWIGFWCFAVYYIVRHLLPALQAELLVPR